MKKCKNRASVETLESRLFLSTARVALISDYGTLNPSEGHVAAMVKAWDAVAPLNAILTSGDNDQSLGNDYVNRVGAYYGEFIFGRGSATQRFLPSPGNHDWNSTDGLTNYTSFFTIPGSSSNNERYYNYTIGPVEFFMLDSDPNEPDGTSSTSTQAQWLQAEMLNSVASWQVVMFHHTAYSSSGSHGSSTWMQWPFQAWGADLVVSGHNHVYERVNVDGLRFITNGVGGYDGLNSFSTPISGSEVRYNAENGAILMDVTDTSLSYQFINTAGQIIDTFSMINIPMPRLAISAAQNATEGTVPGLFTITRSVITSGALTVNYSVGGTASADDYGPISRSVTFIDGQTTATIEITTINDTLAEGDETVILTLPSDPGYLLANSSATIIIADDDVQTTAFQQGQNGYLGTVDTYVHSYNPNTAYAASPTLNIDTDDPVGTGGYQQSLIRFETVFGNGPGQIPLGSTILSAQLQLNVTNTGNPVNVHRMLTGWAATSTWNSLSGGVSTDGSEAASGIEASFTPSSLGLYTLEVASSLQAWANDPASFFGWLLTPTGTDGVDIDSAEGGVKPRLVVTYAAGTPLPTLSVSASDASASEAGDPGQFTITRSNMLGGNVTVSYSISGTATNGTDYASRSGSVVIPDGATSITLDVAPFNDALAEGDESVLLTILNDASYRITASSSATVIIADDDLRRVTFQQGTDTNLMQNVPGANYPTAISLTVDADEPATTAKAAQALLQFTDLFGSFAGQIPFGSTILSAQLQLNVNDTGNRVNMHRMLTGWTDADTWNSLGNGIQTDGVEAASAADAFFTPSTVGLYTLDVTAALRAWASSPSGSFGWALLPTGTDGVDIDSFEGSIKPRLVVDYAAPANLPTVSIAVAANGAEPATNGSFKITRSGDTSTGLAVHYTVGGSATAGADYTSLAGVITIPANATSALIDLPILDDSTYEGNENVVLTLSSSVGYIIGSPSFASAVIVDDEFAPPTVSISASGQSAEPNGQGQFIVTRVGDTTLELVVHYTISGTATNGADYRLLPASVIIAAGDVSAEIDLIPINDALPEPDETVTLTITSDAQYIAGTNIATVTISDDDLKTAAFAQTIDTNLMQRTPDASYASAASLTVLTDKPRTAKTSQALLRFDSLFGSGAGQIPEGSTVLLATLQLNVTDGGREVRLHRMLRTWSDADTWNSVGNGVAADGSEAIASADTSFTTAAAGLQALDVTSALQAWSNDPASAYGWALISAGTDGVAFESAEGVIKPRLIIEYVAPVPRPIISVVANDANASEPADPAQFTVSRSGDTSHALTVYYAVGGTATAGSDYAALSGSVTLPAGATLAFINLSILDDGVYEGNETVVLTILPNAAYTIDTSADATATIADDETPPSMVVTIEATTPTAYEAGGDGVFTVMRTSDDLSAQLVVRYEVGGSATAADHAVLNGFVTILAGARSATFSVTPIDDTDIEEDETVLVTLSAQPAYAVGASASATVTIVSDDVPQTPAAPTELKGVAVNGGRVDLTWIDNATNETGYTIEWSADGINWTTLPAPANAASGTVTGLIKSTFYYFRVKADNVFGSSDYSNVLKIRTTSK